MANITVDAELCTGCGLCENSCPEVFKVEEDNVAHVIGQECTEHDLNEVAESCPVEAIKVE
ncbi:MAG: ferredoxin [Candidatus Omnitrophota bacterium]